MLSTFFPADARSAHSASRLRSLADSAAGSNVVLAAHAASTETNANIARHRSLVSERNEVPESILVPIVKVDATLRQIRRRKYTTCRDVTRSILNVGGDLERSCISSQACHSPNAHSDSFVGSPGTTRRRGSRS